MKITYSGKLEALTPAEAAKIETKFAKLAKLLDAAKGEAEARIILNVERHLHHTEITVHYREHDLVGIGAAADMYAAMCTALEKIETQTLRLRERLRDTKRGPKQEKAEGGVEAGAAESEAAAEAEAESASGPQVFRINHHDRRKPMTLEEAMIAIEGRNYVVYRDTETDRVSVLVRRRDGNFDLIEA